MKTVCVLMNLVISLGIVTYCRAVENTAATREGRFYMSGCNYESAGQIDQACQNYISAINECPDANFVCEAKLHLSRLNAIACIKAKNFKAAEDEIKSNCEVFENNPGYEWYLFSIAGEYESASQSEHAKEYYAQTIERFPDGKCSENAKLSLSRLKVLAYIESKDYARAEAEIANNAAIFETNPGYEWYLYSIGSKYETEKKEEQAKNYYSQVLSKFPNGNCAQIAQLNLSRLNVLTYIKSGDYAKAESDVQANTSNLEKSTGYEWFLFSIGLCYDDVANRSQEARKYYSLVIEKYPDGNSAKICRLRLLALDAVSSISNSQNGKVLEAIQKMRSDFQIPERYNVILLVAEKYYLRGMETSSKPVDSENLYLKNSLSILENELGTGDLSNSLTAEFSYTAGLNYLKLGNYLKGAEAFESAYQADPKFIYADYCLFAQGICYNQLSTSEKVSNIDPISSARSAFERLIRVYPASSYGVDANSWLKQNATN